jgi:MoaA/NifB/PqqE/SkfB family radical SAM enzyme
MLSIFNQLLQEDVSEIFLNGAGELFLNKDLLNRLRTLSPGDTPYLRKLHLITNASIFTPLQYNLLSDHTKALIKKVDISLDSLDPETYSILRRGANLSTTMTNLKNLISLRKSGALEEISILVVIQKRNVQEIPEIFDFCESNGIDNLCLWKLDDRNHNLHENGITEDQYIEVSQFLKEKKDTSKVRVISSF